MAQRRMFSKSITNSSQFLMMPSSSQNLYFHLGMNADDDGFCEHFSIMRMTDSKPDDLKILQAKGFVNVFDDRVLVISDWKENNYLRLDRYTPSKYLDIYKVELANLSSGIPMVDQMATQVRLGKVRLGKGKNTIAEASSAEWNLETYKKELEDSTRRELNIIALYWDYKKPVLNSIEQARNEIKRNLRAANSLKPYEDARLIKTIEYLQKQANFKWTLETILKYITERELKNA